MLMFLLFLTTEVKLGRGLIKLYCHSLAFSPQLKSSVSPELWLESEGHVLEVIQVEKNMTVNSNFLNFYSSSVYKRW